MVNQSVILYLRYNKQVSCNASSHLFNIINSILKIKLVEDAEKVVLVFPGFWFHQKPGDVRLLKSLPSRGGGIHASE